MKHYRLDAEAVIARREARGLTQAALAKLLGVSRSAMSQFESGQIQPSATTAHDIARALGVAFDEITASGGDEPEQAAS